MYHYSKKQLLNLKFAKKIVFSPSLISNDRQEGEKQNNAHFKTLKESIISRRNVVLTTCPFQAETLRCFVSNKINLNCIFLFQASLIPAAFTNGYH